MKNNTNIEQTATLPKQPRSIALRPALEEVITKFAEDNRWSFSSAIEYLTEEMLKRLSYLPIEN